MTERATISEAGRRIAPAASGRAAKGEGHEGVAGGVIKPRQASIGIEDNVAEHEDERLNPGQQGGSATGAPPGKPSDPSNSA